MSRETYGYLVWGIIALFVAVPELLAAFFGKSVPWPTLSETSWNLQRHSSWFSILFLAGLVVLTVHVVFHWPADRPPEIPPSQPEPPVLP